MKRKALFLFLMITMVIFAGCATQEKDIPVAELAQKLNTTVPFANPLTPLETDMALQIYGISGDDVQEAAVYVGTGGATVDEISVWRAKDADAAGRVKEKVQARIEAQKSVYADYQPDEVPKLEDPLLVTNGNTVILCVSGHNSEAQSVIDSYMK